jgi:hypothetical protein
VLQSPLVCRPPCAVYHGRHQFPMATCSTGRTLPATSRRTRRRPSILAHAPTGEDSRTSIRRSKPSGTTYRGIDRVLKSSGQEKR